MLFHIELSSLYSKVNAFRLSNQGGMDGPVEKGKYTPKPNSNGLV